MNAKTTLWLALAVLFLGSVLYILEHRAGGPDPVMAQTRVFDITTEPVRLIGILRQGERIEAVRKNGNWFLQQPMRARASDLLLNQIAATAERLRSIDRITAEQRGLRSLTLADYGLDPAAGSFYLEAGGRREKLDLGGRTPFGSGVYGYAPETDTVLVLPDDALALLAPSLDALRDRTLFPGSQRRVTRLDLHRREAGFLQLIRRAGGWYVQQPVAWPAEPEMVQQLLDALYVLQVQRFIWDVPSGTDEGLQSPAFRSQVEAKQLAPDQAAVRITVWVEGSDTGEELFLGGTDDAIAGQRYARKGGVPAIFTVPEVLGEITARASHHYRDRRILPPGWEDTAYLELVHGDRRLVVERDAAGDWWLQEPLRLRARAEAVQQVLRLLADMRIQSFTPVTLADEGNNPVLVVKTGPAHSSEEDRAAGILQLYRADAPEAVSGWLGRLGPEGEVLPVQGFGPEHGVADLLDPARYRERRILVLVPQDLAGIQQVTRRGSLGLEREEEGGGIWRLVDAADRELAPDPLRRFLGVLPGLEAEAVVAFEPTDLQPYGLQDPLATINLRYTDTARLQQAFFLGKGEDGAVYALLQGHGFVFRLRNEDAQALFADLLREPLSSGTNVPESVVSSPLAPVEAGAAEVIPVHPLRDDGPP